MTRADLIAALATVLLVLVIIVLWGWTAVLQ